jgi:DNA invertase Pin-like site-specific DNA recombinase
VSRKLGLIYLRQSRYKKYERTVSPEVQEQETRQLPEIRACNEIVVYKDLDLSGGSAKRRKDWLALRARLETVGRDDSVVLALYDQSRSFRNTSEALELYALLEQRPWIDVVFVHGKFDRSPIGEFSYTTLAAAHALERRMAATKIREAKRYASEHGEAVGPLPAGYK